MTSSVLIVEQNSFFRKSFGEVLKMYLPDLFVEEAASGSEALQKVDASPPDFIFMDIHLSGRGGLELTREIKSRYPQIVVSIFTNYDLPEYRESAHQNGVDLLLHKDSVSGADIAELIHSIMSQRGSPMRRMLCGTMAMKDWSRVRMN